MQQMHALHRKALPVFCDMGLELGISRIHPNKMHGCIFHTQGGLLNLKFQLHVLSFENRVFTLGLLQTNL